MEDTELRFHTGIPVGHKFLAILLALAVAGAGCAWLIYRSTRADSAAVLSFNPDLAQQLDPGLGSADHPAIALADFMLNDRTVGNLAEQAHLGAHTPAGRMGEFRADLQLTETPAQQLEVRFQGADSSSSTKIANAVAHALIAWNPAPVSAPAVAAQPTQSATLPAAPATQPAPATQGQSHPAAADAAAPPPAQAAPVRVRDPLSAGLRKLGAQLSGVGHQVDRLGAGGYGRASYNESRQQSLLRNGVHAAQRTLAGLRHRYAKEVADPRISARLNEIHQALDSILPGGAAAAGVSRQRIRRERSALGQATWIVNRETEGVQIEETAHPSLVAEVAKQAAPVTEQAAPPPSQKPAQSAPAPAPSAPPASSAPVPSASPSASQSSAASNPGPAQADPAIQNPWSIARVAVPAQRPPLWPALVAGLVCGLLYFAIAAIAYRRGADDDIYPELRSAVPQRMITPDDPAAIADLNDAAAADPEPPQARTASRQRAAFVFQPDPRDGSAASVESAPRPDGEQLPQR